VSRNHAKERECLAEIEIMPEMAKAGADTLFPDGEVRETADELEVMTRVFRAMVTGRDPRLPSFDDLEFGQVSLQVLLRDMVIGAIDAALED
jgi:hypothetical protein